MFNNNDIQLVFAYNKTANIFRISDNKRVIWNLRNMDKTYLQSVLSRPFVYAEDFAQLKKQVRRSLEQQGL